MVSRDTKRDPIYLFIYFWEVGFPAFSFVREARIPDDAVPTCAAVVGPACLEDLGCTVHKDKSSDEASQGLCVPGFS